jgi:CHAD domain-containing protein
MRSAPRAERATGDPFVSFAFRPDESIEHGAKRIARSRLDDVIAALTKRTARSNGKAVHDARKDLKKLRALVRLLREGIGDKAYRKANAVFRDAGRALSAPRDAKVLVDALDQLAKHFGPRHAAKSFAAVRKKLIARRREAMEAFEKQGTRRIVQSLQQAKKDIRAWNVKPDDFTPVGKGIQTMYRQGRTAFNRARENPKFTKLHEWRKRVKDLWHHLQLVGPAAPHVFDPMADEAHALADVLGDDHDLGVLHKTLIGELGVFGNAEELAPLLEMIAARRIELQHDAMRLGEAIYRQKPKVFENGIEEPWKAWHAVSG